ncbi:superoxide dismutase family protein [Bizionia gelidisalsuginis]|uniref:Superoxide dismutase [Cu-Zn] n=2 Tax=Bizionia TaxID=283785 RepID=A0A8H2QG46_9FLAO|nr:MULTISPECIES: superoxide dismutase family protein [Bizionia]TYB77457.1 superoxide dismutase family protein [Bizionia saleffrena]TYC17862.1 superoxide dismutase family protein [Bizionia gelidisalsuginis]
MKKITQLALALTFIFAASCKEKKETPAAPEMEKETEMVTKTETAIKVKVILESKSDSKVTGNAVFTQVDGKVKMVAILEGLDKGTHAIHLHDKADCSAADGSSAGGHWNPTGQPHGKWGDSAGYHKGDIGNFEADDKGYATVNMTTDEWCIGCGDDTKDILGKSIIIHQGADDFTSQPSGNAGFRVSCGGIIK